MVELDVVSVLVYIEESNDEFLMGFTPPTNCRIFNISNPPNIEAIGLIVYSRNITEQVWIPLSTIAVVHGFSNSNNNILNPLVTYNIPYRIFIYAVITFIIGIIDQLVHTIVATNNI